jgi:hypothetical protein
MKIYTKRHLEYLRHSEESPQTKTDGIWMVNVDSIWTTFQRLPIGKVCCFDKNTGKSHRHL